MAIFLTVVLTGLSTDEDSRDDNTVSDRTDDTISTRRATQMMIYAYKEMLEENKQLLSELDIKNIESALNAMEAANNAWNAWDYIKLAGLGLAVFAFFAKILA